MESFNQPYDLSKIDSQVNFDLSKNTSYGLGGLCKTAYFPKTEEEAVKIYKYLNSCNEKFFVLGKGSNILASSKFFDGSVICTSKLKKILRVGDEALYCSSGTNVAELLKYCTDNGLSGLEFLAGIPASVGGLVCMNAAAGGKSISDVLISCTVFDGKLRNFSNKLCSFGYKYSTMRDINCLILNSIFKIEQNHTDFVKANINRYLSIRRKQPKGKSCGCVFKNPAGMSAGKLIDRCGLKGAKFGKAKVSCEHANFIINDGATPFEIYSLINYVKKKVYEICGICLEEEVVYIGEFNDTFS